MNKFLIMAMLVLGLTAGSTKSFGRDDGRPPGISEQLFTSVNHAVIAVAVTDAFLVAAEVLNDCQTETGTSPALLPCIYRYEKQKFVSHNRKFNRWRQRTFGISTGAKPSNDVGLIPERLPDEIDKAKVKNPQFLARNVTSIVTA